MLRTFAITLLFAVGLVLATLISARVLDRAAELGLLKAVGLTPVLMTVVVAVELALLAATAAVAGAVLGSWIMLRRRDPLPVLSRFRADARRHRHPPTQRTVRPDAYLRVEDFAAALADAPTDTTSCPSVL